MSESNNKSIQRAQPPLKTSHFVCLFVVGSDGMSTLQQLTMQEIDGVCVCVWKGKHNLHSKPVNLFVCLLLGQME